MHFQVGALIMVDAILKFALTRESIFQASFKKAKENPDSDWGFLSNVLLIQYYRCNSIAIKLSDKEKTTLTDKLKDQFCYLVMKGYNI